MPRGKPRSRLPAPARARAAGCTFCAGTSLFGAAFMLLLGILIKNNYQLRRARRRGAGAALSDHARRPLPEPSCQRGRSRRARPPLHTTHRFIGEWYERELPHHAPTEEQIALGAKNCFIVAGVYFGWVVFALGCVCVMNARGSRLR